MSTRFDGLHPLSLLLSLNLAVAPVACSAGDSSSSGTIADNPTPGESASSEAETGNPPPTSSNASGGFAPLAEAYCAVARTCCEQSGAGTAALTDCEPEFQRQIGVQESIDRGTVLLEPEFDECVRATRALAPACSVSARFPSECATVLRGTVAKGGPCKAAVECADNGQPLVCWKLREGDEDPEFGVCQTLTRSAEGEPCSHTANSTFRLTATGPASSEPSAYCDTEQGLWCDNATDMCTRFQQLNEPCRFGGCAPELYCDDVCLPTKADGDSCESWEECPPASLCDDGTCRPRTLFDGGLCEGDFD